MMKTMLSTLMTITIVSLTARPIVLTLTMLCAGAAAANRPEFQNRAPVQQPAASPSSGQAADAKPEGEWEGTLDAGPVNLRIVLHITKIDVGGHSLNLLIGGHGSPAVILEGGFGEGIAGWSLVQKEIANFAQTVSYDRTGLGQSEPGPKPRSAKQIATELHTALQMPA